MNGWVPWGDREVVLGGRSIWHGEEVGRGSRVLWGDCSLHGGGLVLQGLDLQKSCSPRVLNSNCLEL